jgi:hypothetical protein
MPPSSLSQTKGEPLSQQIHFDLFASKALFPEVSSPGSAAWVTLWGFKWVYTECLQKDQVYFDSGMEGSPSAFHK